MPAATRRAGRIPALRAAVLAAAVALAPPGAGAALAWDPFLDRVIRFEPGDFAGFGADQLPDIVLGEPEGLGDGQGSTHVVSLGHGGSIVVAFANNGVVDGEGDDLVIYENPFVSGSLVFRELAFVDVSADGRNWTTFPWDTETGEGLAGREPVFANSTIDLDPLSEAAGGDRFDLADVGLDFIRFVRLRDAGDEIHDPGNDAFPGSKGGFDLDAAGAIHAVRLGCVRGEVRHGGQVVAGARVHLKAEGQRRRGRSTRASGRFRFCRLRPGVDYDVKVKVEGLGRDEARVYVDEVQRIVWVDLLLR